MLKTKLSQTLKGKLSQTLRSWLPILQSSIEDLKDNLTELSKDNPFVSIKEGKSPNNKKSYFEQAGKGSFYDTFEALSVAKKSVYELLDEQIAPPLFPTPKSQALAHKIVQCLNSEGYFEFDAKIVGENADEIEKIRQRFKFLEPSGVGAKDFKEAYLFSLENYELDSELYALCAQLIKDFENIKNYAKEALYKDALKIIKKIQTPPFIDYLKTARP